MTSINYQLQNPFFPAKKVMERILSRDHFFTAFAFFFLPLPPVFCFSPKHRSYQTSIQACHSTTLLPPPGLPLLPLLLLLSTLLLDFSASVIAREREGGRGEGTVDFKFKIMALHSSRFNSMAGGREANKRKQQWGRQARVHRWLLLSALATPNHSIATPYDVVYGVFYRQRTQAGGTSYRVGFGSGVFGVQ